MKKFEIGIYSLAEILEDPFSRYIPSFSQKTNEMIQMADYADKLGLDLFGVGEHHRLDYAVSSPQVVLSSIAQRTKQIKLTALTSLLNTADPVRLFEDFATLDLLSDGRVEFTAGRGAFVEAFPLFGYDEAKYDELFEEHLQLFLTLNEEKRVTWEGQFRPALQDAEISPRPKQAKLPISIGVGGTIESAQRAGQNGCGLTVVMIGGIVKKYLPLIETYKQSFQGNSPYISIAAHTFIRETEAEIEKEFYQYYGKYWSHLTSHGIGGAMGVARTDMAYITSEQSTLLVGTPAQIIRKIHYQRELFGHHRFLAQVDFGGLPIEKVKKTIHLLATEVAPAINNSF